jgi:uncharacterized protein
MLYVIEGHDAPESLGPRRASRPEHLARVLALKEQGRLILAGPMPAIDAPDPGPAGFVGSLIVAEFPSREAAQLWANADPYLSAGAWASVEVRPFLKVAP